MASETSGGVYFETADVIVTLILLGRVLEARAKKPYRECHREADRATAENRDRGKDSLDGSYVREGDVMPIPGYGHGTQRDFEVAIEDLKVGDLIRVRDPESASPSTVASSKATFDGRREHADG